MRATRASQVARASTGRGGRGGGRHRDGGRRRGRLRPSSHPSIELEQKGGGAHQRHKQQQISHQVQSSAPPLPFFPLAGVRRSMPLSESSTLATSELMPPNQNVLHLKNPPPPPRHLLSVLSLST
uniref:Uncharacterized protein n=1 Tax=Oryza meridionalis TaxID=40149 RepID=A0A0E0EDV6_9ORYZ